MFGNNFDIKILLIRIPVLLIAFTVHEFFHGFTAYKLGDYTAKNDGRLSLNPKNHIDPVGLICIIFFRFGWAKPVRVNPVYFRNPKRDMALVALAGPLSNFFLAFFSAMIYFPIANTSNNIIGILNLFLAESIIMNISLGVFNLIPIPPLDGSKIFAVFFPKKVYDFILQNDRNSFIILVILMFTGILGKILNPLVSFFGSGILNLVQLIYSMK